MVVDRLKLHNFLLIIIKNEDYYGIKKNIYNDFRTFANIVHPTVSGHVHM